MATHEVYIGGPPTANYNRGMFPAAPFNAGLDAFQRVKVSAHKGPTEYQLGRMLWPGTSGSTMEGQDYALQQFIRDTALVQGDVLGSILVPQDVIFKGMFFRNEVAVGNALVITPSLRGVTGGSFPTINGNAVGKGYGKVGATAWQATSASLGDAADGTEFYIAAPTIVDLTLTTLTSKEDLFNLKLSLIPIVSALQSGVY